MVDRLYPNTKYSWLLDIEESSLPPTSATFKLVDATGNNVELDTTFWPAFGGKKTTITWTQ